MAMKRKIKSCREFIFHLNLKKLFFQFEIEKIFQKKEKKRKEENA